MNSSSAQNDAAFIGLWAPDEVGAYVPGGQYAETRPRRVLRTPRGAVAIASDVLEDLRLVEVREEVAQFTKKLTDRVFGLIDSRRERA